MSKWHTLGSYPFGATVDIWWQHGDEGYRIPDCHARDEETWLDDHGNIISAEYVTHWMPLPEPPND